jgi:hypothetical protein
VTTCSFRRSVADHFAGRIRPAQEARLRRHLPGCEPCNRYYERLLVLAELDPAVPSAKQRLAIGLGLTPEGPTPKRFDWSAARVPLLAGVAAVAGVAMLWFGRQSPESNFRARGAATEPRVWVYRLAAAGKPVELGGEMAADDELAFAVDSPEEARRLLLFGVDEHRHVYWYHPAWLDPATSPTAVPIAAGRHELPEAVAHQLDGAALTLYAVFTQEGITVRDVERDLDAYARRAAWQRQVKVTR